MALFIRPFHYETSEVGKKNPKQIRTCHYINKPVGAFLRILFVAIVAACKRQACLVIVREWLKNMSHTVESCDLVELRRSP